MSSSRYAEALTEAMTMLAEHPDTVFLGQAVVYPGTAQTNTLVNVPADRKIEMPVCEEMQMGISIGLSLQGKIPVSLYPRWNFMILATNQLVNHLDRIPLYSEYRPKVIIRVGVGSERPLYPGIQHVGDFSAAYQLMLKTVSVVQLHEADDILPAYRKALRQEQSTILVEYGDLYN